MNHINHRRQISEKKKREEEERVKVYRVTQSVEQLHEALKHSQEDRRTAVIISSLESKMVFEHLTSALNNEVETIYLRQYE